VDSYGGQNLGEFDLCSNLNSWLIPWRANDVNAVDVRVLHLSLERHQTGDLNNGAGTAAEECYE
jgi:hypothetical protein